ncbi:MAG: sigma factor-like helix-turn-helix DNA-binding protein [Actinomycetota bacterium]
MRCSPFEIPTTYSSSSSGEPRRLSRPDYVPVLEHCQLPRTFCTLTAPDPPGAQARRRVRPPQRAGSAPIDEPRVSSVDELLKDLPDRHRAALILRYVDDLSVGEVAATLGLSLHATESLLARARDQVRRHRGEQRHG